MQVKHEYRGLLYRNIAGGGFLEFGVIERIAYMLSDIIRKRHWLKASECVAYMEDELYDKAGSGKTWRKYMELRK